MTAPTYTAFFGPPRQLTCDACAAVIFPARAADHDRFHAALDNVAAIADASYDFTRNLARANERARNPEVTR